MSVCYINKPVIYRESWNLRLAYSAYSAARATLLKKQKLRHSDGSA